MYTSREVKDLIGVLSKGSISLYSSDIFTGSRTPSLTVLASFVDTWTQQKSEPSR